VARLYEAVALDAWLEDARASHIRNRSGDPYEPSAIRSYALNARVRVKPAIGHMRASRGHDARRPSARRQARQARRITVDDRHHT